MSIIKDEKKYKHTISIKVNGDLCVAFICVTGECTPTVQAEVTSLELKPLKEKRILDA